ncbi:MAG: hydroxymethylglutaryl-CoA synthase [Thermoproteota archaeon]|nr:MAG: hydroxymethylglutaryl-CoA synthase [Candidatus Korarchaeota archaeon]
MKPAREVGIVGWGAYVPQLRVKVEEIADMWGKPKERVKASIRILEKSVPSMDEDTATMAVEAAQYAIQRAGIDPSLLGAVFIGTESKPYAVKPTSTIVAEAIGATPRVLAADFEFACKAGTEAVQCCMALVSSGMINYGMAVGVDTAQGAPGDDLEFSAAAGSAAIILGSGAESAAIITASVSYVTDTPDFWRRPFEPYPRHAEAFTGGPAYFHHIVSAAKLLMDEIGSTPKDYDHVIFHQPNGRFPVKAGSILGFRKEQMQYGLVVDKIGNTYSASSLIGLCNVLDHASPGERVLLVSYGSGAGSDAFDIIITELIEEKKRFAPLVSELIGRRRCISYAVYGKHRGKFILPSDKGG